MNLQNLHKLVKTGNVKSVKKEIAKNKKFLDMPNEKGATCLHIAAQEGHIDMVKMLVEKGASVNALDNDKYSPLLAASSQKHFHVVQFLLDSGADPKATNSGQSGVIHYLIRSDENGSGLTLQKDLIARCCKLGGDVNAKNKFGETPLHQAVMRGSLEMTEFLISLKADVNKVNRFENLSFQKKLNKNNTSFSKKKRHSETCLHKAILIKSVEMVKLLIKHGVDIKVESSTSGTAKEFCEAQMTETKEENSEAERSKQIYDLLREYSFFF